MHGRLYKCFYLCLLGLVFAFTKANAQDITAIDFKGDAIGKVIPDGTTINFNNEIIGKLTADGFIINTKGVVVGGVLPQGFAVSNDQQYLGKVSSDGTVRLPSGKVAGKVLPSGLVVDEFYQVIGGVLSTGIVYNDLGVAVGRLAGNGAYINFEGANVGFVSASGYAYRQTDHAYKLDGKLISAKMVVSLSGDFIGSVTPGGQVSNFENKFIGKLHANGYVYDASNKIIGHIVKTAYAFDNQGQYLGFVSYNGEVLEQGKVVGKLVSADKIANLKGEIIGFTVDLNAVALDNEGHYLGYAAPNGEIRKGHEITGYIGPKQTVRNASGQVIGLIASKGPVFDYLGNLKAEAVPNGHVVSFSRASVGFMRGDDAFDNTGVLLGRVLKPSLMIDLKQDILALTGIGTEISVGSAQYKVSPMGYFYTSNDALGGRLLPLDFAYTEDGRVFAHINENGVFNLPSRDDLKIYDSGFVVNAKNEIEARQITPDYAFLYDDKKILRLSETNVFDDAAQKAVAKIVPEYMVVSAAEKESVMPLLGEAAPKGGIVLNVRGEVFGYADINGQIYHAGKKAGQMTDGGVALNLKNAYAGGFVPFGAVVDGGCNVVGVMNARGEVRSVRDNYIGKTLLNGQIISEVGQNMGHLAQKGPVFASDGHIIGFANETGHVFDEKQQPLGCLDKRGRLYEDMIFRGKVFENALVMNFDNKIIGRLNVQNQAIDAKGNVLGYATPDGSITDAKDDVKGLVFKYKVAFDRTNNFIGYVSHDGRVYNDQKEVFGSVMADGLVINNDKAVGYALYDLYVYDENGFVLGYLTKTGTVMSLTGQSLGKADRGFLVKDGRLIGRGNRDYFVRNNQKKVIGEILMSGDVIDNEGVIIGTVSKNGDVRERGGRALGTARPLQYYVVQETTASRTDEQPSSPVGVIDVPAPAEAPSSDFKQKVIGVVMSPNGKYIADVLVTGEIFNPETGEIIGNVVDGEPKDLGGNVMGVFVPTEQEEPQKPKPTEPSRPFIPPYVYGIEDPVEKGPGGGFGQGERYDPMRSYYLSQAQRARVEDIKVGKLSSEIKPSSYTGYQDNWDNANYTMSSWRVDMSEMILADKPIPAVLARTIMDVGEASNVPVTAIVERNVYAEDGRNIIIPAGSRVMGASSGGMSGGGESGGAVRTGITWTRLVRPDGSAFEFADAQTGDAQGRGGALGYLDEQLLKRYLAPIVTNLATSAVTYIMASGSTTTSDSGTTTQDARAAAAEDARQGFQDDMQQVFQDLLQRATNINTVTYVPAGTRLIIYPKVDLWLRTFERENSENYAKEALSKPEKLIDDTDPMGSTHSRSNRAPNASSGSSRVVYSGDDADVAPAQPPLIDDAAYSRKRQRQKSGATPPPVTNSSAGGRSQSSDTSSASLF